MTALPEALCLHCRSALTDDAPFAPFCCHGCRAVHALLLEQGLGRYYDLAGTQVISPVAEAPAARSHLWLEPLLQRAKAQSAGGGAGLCALQLDVQGIECAACVWLMNETFARRPGSAGITVNPALGQVTLRWHDAFDLTAWLREVEAFGYQFGPARKQAQRRSLHWPLRLGLSVALTINVMLFSLSFYFGLNPSEPEVFSLFTWLTLALSTAVVAIGGWPFFAAAVRGLRSGVLHLDVPIALGIALVYAMSLVQLRNGRGDLTYFDTLNTFITLMVLGRFLQERMLERNRRFLLEDDGAESIMVRRVEGEQLCVVPAPRIRKGEVLLIAPGELIAVDGLLLEPTGVISTDWVTGESAKRVISQASAVPAGSFNAGSHALHIVAETDFADSPLVALLRQTRVVDGQRPRHLELWNQIARKWVVKVLLVAGAGFLAWLPEGLDTAINVAASLLVITCPCAIGIAIPLAYEITQSQLRRNGFFVRSADLLDRLTRITKVLFDKTGTLTLGRLEIAKAPALDDRARNIAYNLAARSNHPVSRSITRALEPRLPVYEPSAHVAELDGKGLEWQRPDGLWRLGRADWAVDGATGRDPHLSCDGVSVAAFETREALRPDAVKDIAALCAQGLSVWLISGDDTRRVVELARTLGLDPSHALSGQRPEDKAAVVRGLDAQDTLFLGDGVNDSLAFSEAFVAGTPVIDRPVMPGKSDFFLVGDRLTPLGDALARAAHLRRVVQRILTISLTYNVFAIALALLGKMSPLLAAISMPASTLALISFTVLSLRQRADAKPAAATQTLRPVGQAT